MTPAFASELLDENMTSDTFTKLGIEPEKLLEDEGVVDNKGFTWANTTRIFSNVGLLMINLSLVYFLEYTITTSFTVACASQIIDKEAGRENQWVYENSYVIFNFCYQIGVFISRSSLSFIKIKRVWTITAA